MSLNSGERIVLINETEVEEDVARLKKTLGLMDETLALLNNIVEINSSFKGDVAISVSSASSELIDVLNKQRNDIDAVIKRIVETAEKYKTIDSKIKDQVNTSFE